MAGGPERCPGHAGQPCFARRYGAQHQFAVIGCRRHGALFLVRQFFAERLQFEQWKDNEFDDALKTISEATDPKVIAAAYAKAHERLVDNPPWLYVVHDLNPRAMSPKVKGFVSPQSWFLDLTLVSLQ
jgi:peptide/nickel transport system substrate-binding protein